MLLQRGSWFERKIRDDGKTVKYGIQLQQDTMCLHTASIRDGYGTIPLHNVLTRVYLKQPVIIVLNGMTAACCASLTALDTLALEEHPTLRQNKVGWMFQGKYCRFRYI
jgi:hypothetical protein